MLDKFEYEKKIIGQLIKYYRKQSTYTVDSFILDNNKNRICSKNTLYRLEEGKTVSDETIYHLLAEKLGKTVIFERYDIYERLEMYRKLLVDNIVDFSKTNLEKLESRIIIDINKYKNALYIDEMLLLYRNLIQDRIYSKNKPLKKDINVLLYLKDKLSQSERKIIIYYFYVGLFNRGNYGIDLNQIIKEGKQYVEDPLFYEIKFDYLFELNMLHAYNHLITHELPKIDTLTAYQKYWLYRMFEIVQVNLEDFHAAYKSMEIAYEIVQSSDLGHVGIWGCYLRLGFDAYCMKKYELAVDWLMKAFEEKRFLGKDLVMLCASLEKLGKINLIKQILQDTDCSIAKSAYAKKVYTYYKLKYQKDIKNKKDIIELENYICDTLKPFFETYGQVHKDTFNEDLKEYVKITGNYKKYFLFNS